MQQYCLSSKLNEETKIYNSHGLYGRKCGYIYTSEFNNAVYYVHNNIVQKKQ